MKAKLEDIVGKENVVDDPEILNAYSQDQSLVEPKMPQVVAFVITSYSIHYTKLYDYGVITINTTRLTRNG